METSKVYYTDLRTSPTSNLLDKMERLVKRAGIEQLPLKDSLSLSRFTSVSRETLLIFGRTTRLAWQTYCATMVQNLS